MEKKTLDTQKKRFLLAFLAMGLMLFVRDYSGHVNSYNSTLLSLSYDYGFISRGLFGTIFAFVDKVLPISLASYPMVQKFVLVVTLLFYVLLLAFFIYCLKRCDDKMVLPLECMIMLYGVYAVTFFGHTHNFGRVDVCMTAVAIICAMLVMSEKAMWICIPFSIIGVMFHQGYVFMFFNITLALLLYKAMTGEGKKAKKAWIILILSFLAGSAFFLYFELFSHSNGEGIYDQVVAYALSISEKSEGYHEGLLQHEILGIDVGASEIEYHNRNFVEFPFFIVMFFPYILYVFRFFKGIIKGAVDKRKKIMYGLISIGGLTMLPDFMFKCDYARWVFALITYYAIMIIALVVLGDEAAKERVLELHGNMKKHPAVFIFFVLPILLTPLWDVNICRVSAHVAGDLNRWFFHLWTD